MFETFGLFEHCILLFVWSSMTSTNFKSDQSNHGACDKEAMIWQIKFEVPAHKILMSIRTFSAGARNMIVVRYSYMPIHTHIL